MREEQQDGVCEVCDVVVVGGGLAGLCAGRRLKERNVKLRVLVLEAKGRVGGRTLTLNLPGSNGLDSWDMGGQWVGRSVCVENPMETPDALQLDSMTLKSYMEKHIWTTQLTEELELCTRSVFGMESSQLSFLYFLMYSAAAGGVMKLLETTPGSAQEYKVKGGTQQLSKRIAQQLGENVRLGSAVTAIWQNKECVEVQTGMSAIRCKAAIVSCPPHMAAQIEYHPALPLERQRLAQCMPVGHMTKFIITYSTMENRRNAVVSSLVKYLGPKAASYIHYEEKDWAQEEYNGGCPVNVMVPGMLTFYHPGLRKPCGRIYWAGTETTTRWCGYLSGAVQSGQRAALEVLADVSPDVLSHNELQEVRADLSKAPLDLSQIWNSTGGSNISSRHLVGLTVMAVAVGRAVFLLKPGLGKNWLSHVLGVIQK